MHTTYSYVGARIDTATKERVSDALEAMGLSISDAILLLIMRVAYEQHLPFEIKVPNATTQKAIRELESGKSARFNSIDTLMDDLNDKDN